MEKTIRKNIKRTEEQRKVFFTITGTRYFHGKDFIEKDMQVHLIKDPENEYDSEAIKVELEGLGQIGHVANSPYTVIGDSYSAGRLYDKIGDTAVGTVLYNVKSGILCCISLDE